jgi:hypothetical protein
MNAIHISIGAHLSRRTFLRGAGVTLMLPWLEAMIPSFARGAVASARPPRRFVGISNALGLHGRIFEVISR